MARRGHGCKVTGGVRRSWREEAFDACRRRSAVWGIVAVMGIQWPVHYLLYDSSVWDHR